MGVPQHNAAIELLWKIHPVRARRAEREERAALWGEGVETQPGYTADAERTCRQIPVVGADLASPGSRQPQLRMFVAAPILQRPNQLQVTLKP